MKFALPKRRTLALFAVLVPLAALLGYVAVRSGPLAPVNVTEAKVQTLAIQPALFGIGTVQARHTQRLGATLPARVRSLSVDVGDAVRAGQVLGELDPVDLDERVRAQDAARRRAQASLREAQARQAFAAEQARRYAHLLAARSTSEETARTRQQELASADAQLSAAREEVRRLDAEQAGLRAQRSQWRLVAASDGVVTAREAEPGSTVLAGQTVLELVDPRSLWINVRLDQARAAGLARDLPARVALRSHAGQELAARVLRVEPKADAVTEEMLAKVVLDVAPAALPPLGELAEVTIHLPPLQRTPVVPNAALQRQGERTGVWKIVDGRAQFAPVQIGRADLDGQVQVLGGLSEGETIIVYSEKALARNTRVHGVAELARGAS
ncbi:efflux RND transporter periplasmic adaptor subunit [Comamonas badia]|uniref:efflux RND transporter periplasmic adaptor subunit n=1 Tax=Comamonas badia TaxID=265291 RepID=UPI000420740B|nr:efflux RND transporter periplasmic adaptor subunit [Comamonas badia]